MCFIKPLEWTSKNVASTTFIFSYCIHEDLTLTAGNIDAYQITELGRYNTILEAKAAAQADFEERIKYHLSN